MSRAIEPIDAHHMRAALALARRGLGSVWPNPAVGCVLVKNDVVIARGWTQPGGRPHAEIEALERAGGAARGACAYVTLEPCNHHGETPPCTQALLAAEVARVVGAIKDPDPRTKGAGFARLRSAGVAVVEDVLATEAAAVNAGFIRRIVEGRPLVTMKTATTLDGRIAARGGASQWITGRAARERGHLLRASHDAVMIGVGTALADNPALTCRVPGLEDRSPVRIVLDSKLRLPSVSVLATSARDTPTWIMTLDTATDTQRYTDQGIEIIKVPSDNSGRPDLPAALSILGSRGLTRILVEGGGVLGGALLQSDLVDRIAWFRSGTIMGGDGVPAVAGLGITHPDQMARFALTGRIALGADFMEGYERRRSAASV